MRSADPFGRHYGIGKVTVVSGAVAVTLVGVVTVTEVIGVLTVTVAATVAGNVGMLGVDRRTVGGWSIAGDRDCPDAAVADGADGGRLAAAAWPKFILGPPVALGW
jgi:hypothetical protein